MTSDKRIKKVCTQLEKKRIDCVITLSPSNIFYLTGLYNAEGYLCIDTKNITFFTTGIYYQYAVDKQKILNIDSFVIEKLEKKNFYRFLKGFKRPAVFSGEISFQKWKLFSKETGGRLKVIDDFVRRMRAIKEQEEILNIKKAKLIAEKILSSVRQMLKPGISELDISAEILYKTRKLGGDKESFQPIVASGINSSYPHHLPSKRKFGNNDVVVIDIGVCIDGYNSDITDTFFIGRPSEEMKKVHNAVMDVHRIIKARLEEKEISCKNLHKIAFETLKKFGFEKFFTHGLGHGIGIDVHELPVLSPSSKDTLEQNMVFTIEPGIYLPGKFGIRIERIFSLDNIPSFHF